MPCDDKDAPRSLAVVSWNVLAHVHTHWDSALHCGADKAVETEQQRIARHLTILRRLKALKLDVALLQEVDEHFIPMGWQSGLLPCGESLDGYVPYRSYNDRSNEGTVVRGCSKCHQACLA